MLQTFEKIINMYTNNSIPGTTILSVLLVVLLLSIYEFFVYRYVSHRSFYNKSFNIAIAIIPFFISTIILCLQANVVITLGTIGALAIIRFRTAVKDPVDMLYLLWSVYIGIICGCQLYEVGVLTSLMVTIVLIVLNHLSFGSLPFVIIIHSDKDIEKDISKLLNDSKISYKTKSRNYSEKGYDYAIEASTKKVDDLKNILSSIKAIKKYSIIEYDSDDIV